MAIALTAAKFGTRPSALLGLADDAVSFDFDNCAAMKLERARSLLKVCARPRYSRRPSTTMASLAAASLVSLGLSAGDLEGGIHAWREAGLPIDRKA